MLNRAGAPALTPSWRVTANSYMIVNNFNSSTHIDTSQAFATEVLVRGDCLGSDFRFADFLCSESFFSHKYEGGGVSFATCSGQGGSYNETNPGFSPFVSGAKWTHLLVAVTAGTALTFYIDGTGYAQTLAARWSAPVKTLTLGFNATPPNGQSHNPFTNGNFALARVWQGTVTQNDVWTILDNLENVPRTTPDGGAGLMAEYLFTRQNPHSTLIRDSGPYGAHGTIFNRDYATPLYTGVPLE